MLAERLDVSCESLKYTKLLLLLLLYWVHPNSEVNNPLNSTEASSLLSSLLPICGSDVVAQRGPARGPAPVLLILSVGTFLDKSVFYEAPDWTKAKRTARERTSVSVRAREAERFSARERQRVCGAGIA